MTKTIGTHDGNFHADEVLACALLRRLPAWTDACIVRTRDPSVLATCDAVVDVGGVYDPATMRYDHHQRGFAETLDAAIHDRVKLSSAGLVYKHHGREVIRNAAKSVRETTEKGVDAAFVELYDQLVEAVDALDNGIPQWPAATVEQARPLYAQCTSLSARVARLNGLWNEEWSDAAQRARFDAALEMVSRELDEMLRREVLGAWLPGRAAVVRAMEDADVNAPDVRSSGVLVLERYVPWKEHLHALEEAAAPPVLYVVYPEDDRHPGGRWRVQAVAEAPGTFRCRRPLPEAWRGLDGKSLDAASGIPGCVFVHAAGFVGGHETRAGAVEMARVAAARDI